MTSLPRTTSLRSGRPLRFEPLEPRLALATLGLGIRVLENNANNTPGVERTAPLEVGKIYWVEVLAQDIRAGAPPGIIGLPLNLSWDSDNLELLNPPAAPTTNLTADQLTAEFPLNRAVTSYNPAAGHKGFVEPPGMTITIPPPNLGGLRGASLPNAGSGDAIGGDLADFGYFSRLQFRALAAGDDTPFTLQLAGSMSFADADALQGVSTLSSTPSVLQMRDETCAPLVTDPMGPGLAVTEFLQINPIETSISLSGFVYADTNLNGILDTSASGVPLEFGLPNVEIKLFQGSANTLVATTTTGPDGWYHFEDLNAGTYRIVETQPARYVSSLNSLGTIVAPANAGGDNPPNLATRRGVVGVDQFSNILIRGAEHGINYNFGENLVPNKKLVSLAHGSARCAE